MKTWQKVSILALAGLIAGSVAGVALAQEPGGEKQGKTAEAPTSPGGFISGELSGTVAKKEHRFWDKKNDWLFAGVGAGRALDYFSTLNMRRRGVREIFLNNETVDNHAAFAAIEAAATGVSIGVSYLFHHYGHHKLERWTSGVHFGLATSGAVRNYCLKTVHPGTLP
jgi:hypothetical protein